MRSLQQLGPDLWVADGPVSKDLLIVPYPTRMTIARLDDGGLWIASPVRSSMKVLEEIAALGPVRHLVSPTPRHHWRLEPWQTLFPDARLWSCALGPFTLGRRSLPATRLGDAAPPEWAGQLDQARYRGLGFEEVAFFHRPSRTLIVEDLIQSHTFHRGRPLVNALIRIGGIAHPGGVPRDIRAITVDRCAARAWARRVLSWDFERLVMAHGPVVDEDARGRVERAFSWLLGGRSGREGF